MISLNTLVFLAVFVSVRFDLLNACGGGGRRRPAPRRCHYQTCRATYDNHYTPNPPADGGCVSQRQRVHHHRQTHSYTVHGNCNRRSQNCHERDRVRTWCNCKIYDHAGGWTSWEIVSTTADGNCMVQERQTVNNGTFKMQQRPNCDGVGVENKKVETRKSCLCNVAHFTESHWGEWTDKPGQEDQECVDQIRKMIYENSGVTAEFKVNCTPELEKPAHIKEETRNICRPCKVTEYEFKDWSEWKEVEKNSQGCNVMKRYKPFAMIIKRAEKVNGICPTSQPFTPKTELKEICP